MKTEPEFKVGDWITVNGPTGTFTECISGIADDTYTLSGTNICYKSQASKWECQFAKYGFEKPNFECEILKYFAEDNTLVGYYKTEDGTVYAESWHSLNGRADCGVNNYNTKVHLIPIKKPWYETCKFPVLVWDDDNDLFVIRTRGEYTALYLNACNPLTNDEIEGLKQ